MAEVPLDLLLRQQERVLDELRLMRTDIRDFRADIVAQSAITRRLDQSVQSLMDEVLFLAAQQDPQKHCLKSLRGSLTSTSPAPP